MTEIKATRPKHRTWAHLAAQRRRPSDYEIVSTNMNYTTDNPDSALELGPNIPMSRWYRKYREDSPLRHPDWNAFRDPDELIYRTYTITQDGQESYVEGLLDEFNAQGHDLQLSAEWLQVLARLYTPGRYLLHTAQMASAYLMQMAPASSISHCATFQTGDHLRALSQVAYRTSELAKHRPDFGFRDAARERAEWEDAPAWQGFRELMEKLLVAYDWAEAFVALQLVAKPAIDAAFYRQLGQCARDHNDMLLGLLNDALLRDSERHRRWTGALLRMSREREDNCRVIEGWLARWKPLGDRAIEAFVAALPDGAARVSVAKEEADNIRRRIQL